MTELLVTEYWLYVRDDGIAWPRGVGWILDRDYDIDGSARWRRPTRSTREER